MFHCLLMTDLFLYLYGALVNSFNSGCLQLLEISWNFIDARGKFICQL